MENLLMANDFLFSPSFSSPFSRNHFYLNFYSPFRVRLLHPKNDRGNRWFSQCKFLSKRTSGKENIEHRHIREALDDHITIEIEIRFFLFFYFFFSAAEHFK